MINLRGFLVVCLWTVLLVSVSLAHDNPEDWIGQERRIFGHDG